MSLSCSDCFSDLLCGEATSSIISSSGGDYSPEYSSDFESQSPDAEESIADLLEDETDLARSGSCRSINQPIDASIRAEFVAWILKVRAPFLVCAGGCRKDSLGTSLYDETVQRYYDFQPLTGYLSVNYFDRFLYCHQLPKMNGWALQLLSVACLSLAAKMEEPLVPSLLDLQVGGAKFVFEPRTIQRMELLVLRVLDWRLRRISPFCYLGFFAHKIDPSGTYTEFLATRAKQIILSTIQETSFHECRPSCIAAATILCAANDLPKFSLITAHHADSWCDGLHKDEIMRCDELIRQNSNEIKPMKQAKVTSTDSLSCSSSSSSTFKRRKLSNISWTDDNEGTSIKRVS